MRIQPDAAFTKLSALKAWTRFYQLRLEHLRLLRHIASCAILSLIRLRLLVG